MRNILLWVKWFFQSKLMFVTSKSFIIVYTPTKLKWWKMWGWSIKNIMQSLSVTRDEMGSVSKHTKQAWYVLRAKNLTAIELMHRWPPCVQDFFFYMAKRSAIKPQPVTVLETYWSREKIWAEVRGKWALGIDWQPNTDRSHSAGTQRRV